MIFWILCSCAIVGAVCFWAAWCWSQLHYRTVTYRGWGETYAIMFYEPLTDQWECRVGDWSESFNHKSDAEWMFNYKRIRYEVNKHPDSSSWVAE